MPVMIRLQKGAVCLRSFASAKEGPIFHVAKILVGFARLQILEEDCAINIFSSASMSICGSKMIRQKA